MRILTIIAGVIVLFIVIVLYLAVSYKRANADMPKGCTGDCATCRLHADSAKALANAGTSASGNNGNLTIPEGEDLCDGHFVKNKK